MFGKCEETILPEKDIDQSLNGKGSVVYKAVLDGETVGGVIVAIDTETQHNHLDLLYVKVVYKEKVLESLFGMRLKSYILIQRYGKLVLHILKNATSTFM